MALFIQRDWQLIAGLVLAAAFSTSGCSASRQLFSTTEKANSFRPVVMQGNQIADAGTDQHAAFVEQELVHSCFRRKFN